MNKSMNIFFNFLISSYYLKGLNRWHFTNFNHMTEFHSCLAHTFHDPLKIIKSFKAWSQAALSDGVCSTPSSFLTLWFFKCLHKLTCAICFIILKLKIIGFVPLIFEFVIELKVLALVQYAWLSKAIWLIGFFNFYFCFFFSKYEYAFSLCLR